MISNTLPNIYIRKNLRLCNSQKRLLNIFHRNAWALEITWSCTDMHFCHWLASDGTSLQYSCLENPMDRGAWWAAVHGVTRSQTQLSDFTFTFHFHALEKEMAAHSSILAWRIPGTEEPGRRPSMESHRVGHDWSDLPVCLVPINRIIKIMPFELVIFSRRRLSNI